MALATPSAPASTATYPLTTADISVVESLAKLPITAKAVLMAAMLLVVTPLTSAFAKSANEGAIEFGEASN